MDGHSNNRGHGIPNHSDDELDKLREMSKEGFKAQTLEEHFKWMEEYKPKKGWDKYIHTEEVDG